MDRQWRCGIRQGFLEDVTFKLRAETDTPVGPSDVRWGQ